MCLFSEITCSLFKLLASVWELLLFFLDFTLSFGSLPISIWQGNFQKERVISKKTGKNKKLENYQKHNKTKQTKTTQQTKKYNNQEKNKQEQ